MRSAKPSRGLYWCEAGAHRTDTPVVFGPHGSNCGCTRIVERAQVVGSLVAVHLERVPAEVGA